MEKNKLNQEFILKRLREKSQSYLLMRNKQKIRQSKEFIYNNLNQKLSVQEKNNIKKYVQRRLLDAKLKTHSNDLLFSDLYLNVKKYFNSLQNLKNLFVYFYFLRKNYFFRLFFNLKNFLFFLSFFFIFFFEYLNHYVIILIPINFSLTFTDIISKIPPFF